MVRINFAGGDTAGLDAAAERLYFLAVELEPDPDQAPPWEGGPGIEWRFLALAELATGHLLPVAFTEMRKVVHFSKADQGHRNLPPSHEIVKVAVASLRGASCRYDILVDPDAEELEAVLATGTYEWDLHGLESLLRE